MKRLLSMLAALILAAVLSVSAGAAVSAEIVRAFVYDGMLYTYVTVDGAEKPITKAEAKIGTQTFSAAGRLETVRQAGSPVTWLILVDNSNSMPAFRQEVDAFAGSLAQSAGENARFIVATFGDVFSVTGEDVPAGELSEQIGGIPFDEKVTRLHTAIGQALDYFEKLPRERNELRCMVILSDAVQYDPDGGIPYEELLERVSHSDVILHSTGLGDDQEALDSLGRLANASGGLHQLIGPLTAEEVGAALAENGNGWFVTGFDLAGYASAGGMERVTVTFAAGAELVCRAETEVELPAQEGVEASPPEQALPLPDSRPSTSGGTDLPEADTSETGSGWLVLPVIAAVVVLAAALVAVLLTKKKKAVPAPTEPRMEAESVPAGIYMRLEVLHGEPNGVSTDLELRGELVIGGDSNCDIPLHGENVSPRHARVILSGGAVRLEDLGSQGGTSLNGAAVTQPAVLRSGDRIAIGDAAFRLWF